MSEKVLRVLKTLYAGLPVKFQGYDYYLGEDNSLGIQMKTEVSGVLVPNVNAQGLPLIHGVDWSLKDFLTACENLPDQVINTTCVKADPPTGLNADPDGDERKYHIESNRYLFGYSKFLGQRIEPLGNMFQNDNLISLYDLKSWLDKITKHIYKVLDYAENAVHYVKYGKEPKIDQDAQHLLEEPITPYYNDDDIPF